MEFVKSFFTKTPATLDELHASVMTNDNVSFDIKNRFDRDYKMWKLLMSQAESLLRNSTTPIDKFTTSSLNALPNANFRNLFSKYQTQIRSLFSQIGNTEMELLALISSLDKQYPGIYTKMQENLRQQKKIVFSIGSKMNLLNAAKTRRNTKTAKAAANALQTRLNSLRAGRRRKRQTKRR